jgi:hypothetical protein
MAWLVALGQLMTATAVSKTTPIEIRTIGGFLFFIISSKIRLFMVAGFVPLVTL